MAPAEAVARANRGELAMMPPTVQTCAELARLSRASDALLAAESRHILVIEPRLVLDDGQVWLERR